MSNCTNIYNPCPIYINAMCVTYTGANLPCIGATTNDRLDTILIKIDEKLCNVVQSPNTATDTDSVNITLSTLYNRNIQADVNISGDSGNTLEIRNDGLYTDGGNIPDVDTLQSVTDEGHITDHTDVQMGGLGLGIIPSRILDIDDGGNVMYFDKGCLTVDDTNSNLRIGVNAGRNITGKFNTAFGRNALRYANGTFNTGIGGRSLREIIGNQNTAMGRYSQLFAEADNNTSVGYSANKSVFDGRNTALGAFASASSVMFSDTLSYTTIQTSSLSIAGAAVAAFISSAALVIGNRYTFNLEWLGTAPVPYDNDEDNFKDFKGEIINSSTIDFFNNPVFSTQGTVGYILSVYDQQINSIAIGYNVQTTASNEIAIGNNSNTLLKIHKFVVDLSTTPSSRQFPKWDGNKYVPGDLSSGNYTTNGDGIATSFVVTHGAGFAPSKVLITPKKQKSLGAWVSDSSSTTFTITFATAPSSGTNNVSFSWLLL